MIARAWRERLIYSAMSVFVVWHTAAIVVAPASDHSALAQALRGLLQPYLTLFRLDNRWDFYAPNVGKGHQFRYVMQDQAGTDHAFVPTDELKWNHPTYWWFRARYDAIVNFPGIYGDSVAASLCQKHARLAPVFITLLKVEERDFTAADHLSGKHPLDPDFVIVNTLNRFRCPGR